MFLGLEKLRILQRSTKSEKESFLFTGGRILGIATEGFFFRHRAVARIATFVWAIKDPQGPPATPHLPLGPLVVYATLSEHALHYCERLLFCRGGEVANRSSQKQIADNPSFLSHSSFL